MKKQRNGIKRPALHRACKIFPPLSEDLLNDLADDISENGLLNPIVMLNNKLLDGRNRFAACQIANVEPRFVEFKGEDPVSWVASMNLARRHLSASQKAVIALDLLPMLEKEAKQRQRNSNSYKKNGQSAQECANQETGRASEAAARVVGASARYIEMVKEINNKKPELIDQIRSGELTLHQARKLSSVPSTNGKHRSPKNSPDDATRVIHGDCLDLIPTLEDNSVQFCLTSPPYAQQRKGQYKSISEEKYPEWTVRWMEPLWDKLTDDGSVLIVIRPHLKKGVLSDYVLRTRLALRDDGWFENEELIWLKADAPPLGSAKRPRRTWESILWFSKCAQPFCDLTACGQQSSRVGFDGSIRFGIGNGKPVNTGQSFELRSGKSRCSDVFVAPIGGNQSGINHPAMFPESLADQLIQTFSRPSDLVLDPFVGSGTTCASAKKLGRDFRGFDVSKKYVKLAMDRLGVVGRCFE